MYLVKSGENRPVERLRLSGREEVASHPLHNSGFVIDICIWICMYDALNTFLLAIMSTSEIFLEKSNALLTSISDQLRVLAL